MQQLGDTPTAAVAGHLILVSWGSYDLAPQVLLEIVLEIGEIDGDGPHATSGLTIGLCARDHLADLGPETFRAASVLRGCKGFRFVRPTPESCHRIAAGKTRRPFALCAGGLP